MMSQVDRQLHLFIEFQYHYYYWCEKATKAGNADDFISFRLLVCEIEFANPRGFFIEKKSTTNE